MNTLEKRRKLWHGRRYYSLDAFCKNTYGRKLQKTAIDAGFTCPNRDGTIDTRGCIFCSAGGSGDFAVPMTDIAINCNIALSGACAVSQDKANVIAYFQAYTNTYAPVEQLEKLYRQALDNEQVAGISIATRPDCLPEDVLLLLARLKAEYGVDTDAHPAKFIWIELGLQTIHEATALYIRRGYSLDVFDRAVAALQEIDIPVIAHVILGLPGETPAQMLETIHYLNAKKIFGIKLQLLHILKHTDLCTDYKDGKFEALTKEQYIDLLVDCISHLSPDIVIHRLTGDGPKELLVAPLWSGDKRNVLNTFHHELKLRNLWQGACADTYFT